MSQSETTPVEEGPYAGAPRRVRLSLARIDPLSAMKVGFLLSVAGAIMMVVATAVLWFFLDAMHVFSALQDFIEAVGAGAIANVLELVHFSRLVALVTIISVFEVIVISVLSWLGAVIYNLVSRLVGGVHLVLTDD